MSCWKSPIRELKTLVIAPIHKHKIKTVELYSIKGEALINKYTPAVTIVAAVHNFLLIINFFTTPQHPRIPYYKKAGGVGVRALPNAD
jgi:hypothetical protein